MKIAAVLLIGAALGFGLLSSPDRGAYDFQAFYCAGEALREHADPYRSQPLGACERRVTAGTYAALPAGVILPAPQPGYDIAGFALLSYLPFWLAKAVWGAVLAASITVLLIGLFAVTRLPFGAIFAAFAASLIVPALGFGELFAMYGGALGATMLCLQKKRFDLAGVAAAFTLVEPHLGLPVCAAVFLWSSRSRLSLAISAAALALISLAVLGAQQNVEYFTTVLPLQARSEITSDAQLGSAAVFYAMHVPAAAALMLALAWYVVLGALGVYAAGELARRLDEPAFLAATGAAFAVAGATFMHVTEVFAALPLAMLLCARVTGFRALAIAAMALLAIPWIAAIERGNAMMTAALDSLVLFYLLWELLARRVVVPLLCALATFALLFTVPQWYVQGAHTVAAGAIGGGEYPQAAWREWNAQAISTDSAVTWLLRSLTWAALVTLAAVALLQKQGGNAVRRQA
jgi:hypothetical protein